MIFSRDRRPGWHSSIESASIALPGYPMGMATGKSTEEAQEEEE